MNIALINYRYFISGGPERYMFNIKIELENRGHKIIPFSIKNDKNYKSEYEYLFLDSAEDSVYFAQSKKTIKSVVKSFSRMFYSFEAKRAFRKFLLETKPDIIYAIHFHNKISPSIVDAARELKIPFIHRISDFQYLCPNAHFYNDIKGVCEDCLRHKKFSCVKYRCVHNSKILSALKLLAKILHDCLKTPKKIDAFVLPSFFTLNKFMEFGIPKEKLNHIPTFFKFSEQEPLVNYGSYFLFIGRLEKQKGLDLLTDAFLETDWNLKIIGSGSDSVYLQKLKDKLTGKRHRIEFLGYKNWNEIIPFLENCIATICPAKWYENSPNAILESFGYKKAVIASNIGSLPELAEHKITGLLFEQNSIQSLREQVKYMAGNIDEAKRMGENAYLAAKEKHSPQKHCGMLMEMFEKILEAKNDG